MERRYYIAYGSNLNVYQMKARCPGARIIGTSEIRDYELLFKGSKSGAYLTVEKKEGSSVPVGVWATTEADEAALDRYEGYPTFYYKTEMCLPVLELGSGKVRKRDCYIYIMHENRPLAVPSNYYIRTCLAGYRAFKFNPNILMDAVEDNWRICHEN